MIDGGRPRLEENGGQLGFEEDEGWSVGFGWVAPHVLIGNKYQMMHF